MPKKKRKAVPSDHLSKALEALRERPQPHLGLGNVDKILPLNYVADTGTESKAESSGAGRKCSGKMRMAFNLPTGLCERARNAVWHLSRGELCLNLSSLTEGTLERELTRLEKKYNDGKPFPKRKGRLKGGRLRRRLT